MLAKLLGPVQTYDAKPAGLAVSVSVLPTHIGPLLVAENDGACLTAKIIVLLWTGVVDTQVALLVITTHTLS